VPFWTLRVKGKSMVRGRRVKKHQALRNKPRRMVFEVS
jgi:hypothetical protein